LRSYCRALAGGEVELRALEALAGKNLGWADLHSATSDGTVIYLPSAIGLFDDEQQNFAWYKVLATHQSGHIEFKSYDFGFKRPGQIFEGLRPLLAARKRPGTCGAGQERVGGQGRDGRREEPPAGDAGGGAGDLGRFFALFEEQALARDLFAVAEDLRVDSRIAAQYPGLAEAYGAAREFSLAHRPGLETLPAREALVELLIRVSLGQTRDLYAPSGQADTALQTTRILLSLSSPEAAVEDAAEAAIRLYDLLIRVPNSETAPGSMEPVTVPGPGMVDALVTLTPSPSPKGSGELGRGPRSRPERESGADLFGERYRPADEVLYRGSFKPELGQLLVQAAERGVARGEDLRQRIERLMKNSLEVELMPGEIPEHLKWEAAAENMVREILERDPAPRVSLSSGPGEREEQGPLQADEPDTHVYPEWDCGDRTYRKSWCLVHEKQVRPMQTGFFENTLLEHAALARRIRRQFEVIALQMFRKQNRLEDGEDYDLDEAVDAVIDIRTGRSPSEKLFWRRNKRERSVAAAFLLDMSASTTDPIGGGTAGKKKRLIDVEKEALVLLMNALEILGDGYGVYGFSGYGRNNVEFYRIKDLDEKLTRLVTRRVDGIGPRNATRMGAAIRHATARLLDYPARFRLLFLLSDGRPQDRGYGSAGESRKYAVEDTRLALLEARQQGVTAFCLTVDRNGHDYLKSMMQDMSYEVLWDVSMLPERLPFLYRKLTT
jgi:nitric oxide reductase NorD protein